MKRILWCIVALVVGFGGALQLQTAFDELKPLHLMHSHRLLSVNSLFTEALQESEHLRIEKGYVIPAFRVAGSEMQAIDIMASLTTESGKDYWLENRKEGRMDGMPVDHLIIVFEKDQFSQIWPEVRDASPDNLHPFSLPPVQMDIIGKIFTLESSSPLPKGSEARTYHYLRLEKELSPWRLLFSFSLGCAIMYSAYICFTLGRPESRVEVDEPSMSTEK